jgi:hypothetical protein
MNDRNRRYLIVRGPPCARVNHMIYADAIYLAKISVVTRGRNTLTGYAEHALYGAKAASDGFFDTNAPRPTSRAGAHGSHLTANIHHKVCAGFSGHMLG